ncbi:restriction endonuclease subunit S [Paenibacillus gansuensis]|uniref:Restriction endonuclease subunit S n=1 Tax=Paenibacillus gansuensis TaxID=306542 RepID=A0ABW5P7Z3_9BACL
MERMKSYPSYKASYLPDMSSIPAYWEEQRMKHSFVEVDERSITGAEEMLSVSHITGVTPRSQKNVNMFVAETNVGQKLCRPGYIAINTMWAWMAAMGVSDYEGIVSPSYGVYKPINETYNPNYLDYLLRTEIYRAEYNRRSTGVNSSRLRLYPDRFLDMRFVCPPRNEQDHIVRFLNWKVSQINRLINAKKKQTQLFQEQKRAVVSTAISQKGEQIRFRNLFTLIKGLNITKEQLSESGVPCVNYGQIHSKYGFEVNPDAHHLPCVAESYLETNPKSLMQYGDFVFADTSEDLTGSGNFTYLNSRSPVFAGYHTIIARSFERCNYRYLAYYFDSPQFRSQIQQRVNGVKVYSITRTILNSTVVVLPTDKEQEAIVQSLDKKCASFARLIEKINTEIALLNEYRTRLISDVVTGKMDVRDVEVPQYEAVDEFTEDIEEADEDVGIMEEDSL